MSWVTFHIAICTCARAHPHICISGMAWPIALKFVVNLWPNQFARWAVCAVGGLRVGGLLGWRFPQLTVCAVGGLRGGWRFAQLTVCAVGGLRSGRFTRLAVCAVVFAVCAIGGLRDWRFARLAVCAVGGLRGGRFARFAFGS